MSFIQLGISVLCLGLSVSLNADPFVIPVNPDEIKIMSYNLENLFDWKHEKGKNDYEFLPKNHPDKSKCHINPPQYLKACYNTDWTYAKFLLKLKQIKKVVASQGSLPDIFGVQEIENAVVADRLAKTLGFKKFVITESKDSRGIDVALFYNEEKLRFLSHKEIEFTFSDPAISGSTRNLLVSYFQMANEKILGVYLNHWPSQGAPSQKRYEVAKQLRAQILEDMKQFGEKKYFVVVMGDFNTVLQDDPNGINDVLLSNSSKVRLADVEALYYSHVELDPEEAWKVMPEEGSYFYKTKKKWNAFDRFFVSRSMIESHAVQVQMASYRKLAYPFAMAPYHTSAGEIMIPKGYEHNASGAEAAGYSDHLSIVFKIRFQ